MLLNISDFKYSHNPAISYKANNSYSSAQYKSSETGRCSKPIAIDDNALVINKLTALDDLFYLDIIKKLNNVIRITCI